MSIIKTDMEKVLGKIHPNDPIDLALCIGTAEGLGKN